MHSYIDKCFLYGAGLNAHGVLKYIGATRVQGVIDSNPERVGKVFEGFEIISLDAYLKNYKDDPVVISAYQESNEIISNLEKNGINNFFISLYLQSSVTKIKEIVDYILDKAENKKILFDDSVNILIPLIIDELVERKMIDRVAGFKSITNAYIATYYGLSRINESYDNYYNVTTAIDPTDKRIDFAETTNVCNLMYYNPAYRNSNLEKFKDIHAGKRCFVIGNGPSLRMDDLDILKKHGEICFGSNGIYYAYDRTEWRPDYYVITDFARYKESYDIISKFSGESVFIRRFYNLGVVDYIPGANIYNSPPQRGKFEFSGDIAEAIYSGLTVTFNMLQIAAYMGFKEIYLLGVDFSFDFLKSKGTNHFDRKYESSITMKDVFYHDENLAAYKVAEDYSRTHNFRIFNATRGGKLEVFERVSFEKLFD